MRAVRVILFTFGLILSFIFSESASSQEVISARALYNYSLRNEVAFDARYTDKTLRVRGRVNSIEKNDEGEYYVSLSCSEDDEYVVLFFRNVRQLSSIVPGAEILIEGRCLGRDEDGDVVLENCTLLK
jgi:hypothetical protein